MVVYMKWSFLGILWSFTGQLVMTIGHVNSTFRMLPMSTSTSTTTTKITMLIHMDFVLRADQCSSLFAKIQLIVVRGSSLMMGGDGSSQL